MASFIGSKAFFDFRCPFDDTSRSLRVVVKRRTKESLYFKGSEGTSINGKSLAVFATSLDVRVVGILESGHEDEWVNCWLHRGMASSRPWSRSRG